MQRPNKIENLQKVARCGAKTRQSSMCQSPAMSNGRCRMHGGASTGPKTVAGLEKCRRSNWKHGNYSRASVEAGKLMRALIRDCKGVIQKIEGPEEGESL